MKQLWFYLAVLVILIVAIVGGAYALVNYLDDDDSSSVRALATGSGAALNDPDWLWQFAFGEDQLIALAADGQVNRLQKSGQFDWLEIVPCFQLQAQLGTLKNERGDWYRLAPTGAQRVLAADSLTGEWVPRLFEGNYVLVASRERGSGDGALVNWDTGAVTLLTGTNTDWQRMVRFSADGQFLRYASQDNEQQIATLYARDLAAGTEQVITTADAFSLVPDRYGEHWLKRQKNADGITTFELVTLDGNVTEIAVSTDEAPVWVDVLPDGWWLTPIVGTCDGGCAIEIHTFDEAAPLYFRAFDEANLMDLLVPPNPDHVLVSAPYHTKPGLWVLRTDDEPQWVGTHEEGTLIEQRPYDQRWWLVRPDSTNQYAIWDNELGRMVLDGSISMSARAFYTAYGVVVLEDFYGDYMQVYRASDQAIFELEDSPDGRFQPYVLPDNGLLFQSITPDNPGLFRYDLDTGEYRALIPGHWSLCDVVMPGSEEFLPEQ